MHRLHPAQPDPPSLVRGSFTGFMQEVFGPGAGVWLCRGAAVIPQVSSPAWAKPRRCGFSSCHAVAGTRAHRRAEVARAVHRHRSCAWAFPRARLGQARVCLAPWAPQKPQLGGRRGAASPPERGTTRPRAGLAASCPRCQTPRPGRRAAGVPMGTPLPPRRLGLAGELGCCRARPRCPTPALRGAPMPGSSLGSRSTGVRAARASQRC